MGELLGYDRVLELPPRREMAERPTDARSESNGDTSGVKALKRAKRQAA